MTTNTRATDMLSSLPADLDEGHPQSPDLASLLTHLAHRPIPVGRWHRAWILSALPARIAAGYVAHWVRSGFADADTREASLNEARLSASLKLLGSMSYLRGAVMKLGQTLSNWPEVVPEQFAETLGRLQFEAPPMHFALLREMVHDELGADPTELFAEFDTEAFAAASIGQVHRARLHSGEQVAVKIQYPGIARSIHADLENYQLLMTPMRLGKNWANLMAQVEDIRTMLDREMDYRHEATLQADARRVFESDERFVVPRVYENLSTGRVLTSDFLDGMHIPEWLETQPDDEERTLRGNQVLTSALRLWYEGDLVYADPHPGNYIFLPDGRLGLIDFGSVLRLTPEDIEYCALAEAAMFGDAAKMEELIARSTEVADAQDLPEGNPEFIRRFCAWIWKPMLEEGPFDFSDPAYFQHGAEMMAEMFRKRFMRSKPSNTWLNRNFFGMRAVLHHMGAKVDMGALHRQETAWDSPSGT